MRDTYWSYTYFFLLLYGNCPSLVNCILIKWQNGVFACVYYIISFSFKISPFLLFNFTLLLHCVWHSWSLHRRLNKLQHLFFYLSYSCSEVPRAFVSFALFLWCDFFCIILIRMGMLMLFTLFFNSYAIQIVSAYILHLNLNSM